MAGYRPLSAAALCLLICALQLHATHSATTALPGDELTASQEDASNLVTVSSDEVGSPTSGNPAREAVEESLADKLVSAEAAVTAGVAAKPPVAELSHDTSTAPETPDATEDGSSSTSAAATVEKLAGSGKAEAEGLKHQPDQNDSQESTPFAEVLDEEDVQKSSSLGNPELSTTNTPSTLSRSARISEDEIHRLQAIGQCCNIPFIFCVCFQSY